MAYPTKPMVGKPKSTRKLKVNAMVSFLSLVPAFLGVSVALIIPQASSNNAVEVRQSTPDPTSFGWLNRFAAVGDSYTAGIGSGSYYSGFLFPFSDWKCSRYDQAYPVIMNRRLGSVVENFQFKACSGHQTWQIYDQVNALAGNLNMVTLTAGGNDLCLVDIIKDCIVLAFHGEETCNTILSKAEQNVQTIVRNNIKEVLLALNPKMASGGVVVVNGYARFFNTENEKCATDQDWGLFAWAAYKWLSWAVGEERQDPLPLTIARRTRFNTLTNSLNDVIRDVVNDVRDEVDYKIGFSNWDPWPAEGVDGQMCSPSSSGAYPDPRQPNLLFFKSDTRKGWFRSVWPLKQRDVGNDTTDTYDEPTIPHVEPQQPESNYPWDPEAELEKLDPVAKAQLRSLGHAMANRDLDENGVDRAVYRSSLWNSVNPRAAALHSLDPRAPTIPGCPSDSTSWIPGIGALLPDMFGRIFHPNEDGHNVIASFTLARAIDLRAEVLGITPETCQVSETFRCYSAENRRAYVTANRADINYKDFCRTIQTPGPGQHNWRVTKLYHELTADEMEFAIEGTTVDTINREECLEAFGKIIHGCDGDSVNNPMNWKLGGHLGRAQYTYQLTPQQHRRPWPPLKAPDGKCKGDYHRGYSDYEIYGSAPPRFGFQLSSLFHLGFTLTTLCPFSASHQCKRPRIKAAIANT